MIEKIERVNDKDKWITQSPTKKDNENDKCKNARNWKSKITTGRIKENENWNTD
jgi:hypothetical protein